jgi:transposase
VGRTLDAYPEHCRGCGADLPKSACSGLEPLPHQFAEIPSIEPFVTEVRQFRACCPRCHLTTLADLPPGVPDGAFGPNLRALVVLLSGRFRMSRREVVEFSAEALGLSISVGSVSNVCLRVGQALMLPVREVKEEIRKADVVHADESGWRQRGIRHWVWVAATSTLAFFRIARKRGAEVVREILGESFGGCIVTDRWSAYSVIPEDRRQICWAHLIRDFQGFVDRGGEGSSFGESGLELSKRLFTIWDPYMRGEMSRQAMTTKMGQVECELGELLEGGHHSPDKKVRSFCKKLLELAPSLFLFSRVPGVEPTNNRAERALRPIVLWRKGSFGTACAKGSRFVERMMTVVMTCRLQGRPVLPYLEEVCRTWDRGQRAPPLVDRPRQVGASSPFDKTETMRKIG